VKGPTSPAGPFFLEALEVKARVMRPCEQRVEEWAHAKGLRAATESGAGESQEKMSVRVKEQFCLLF
jgi:hypothetical protein